LTLSEIKAAITAKLLSLTGLSSGKIIWDFPAQSGPALPYIDLSIESMKEIGLKEEIVETNPTGTHGDPTANPPTIGTELLIKDRVPIQISLRIKYNKALTDSYQSAMAVLEELNLALAISDLASTGLSRLNSSAVQSLPRIHFTGYSGGAFFIAEFVTMVSLSRTSTYISEIEITPTIDTVEQDPFSVEI
jgi:hypothetical protein